MVSHYKRQEADDFLQKLTSVNYTDDLVLHANTPAQAECLLHRLEQAARDIGLCEIDKMEFICTWSSKPLKLTDWFTYFCSNTRAYNKFPDFFSYGHLKFL